MPGFLVARSDHGFRFGDPIPVPPGATVLDGKTLVDLGGGRAVFAQFVTFESLGISPTSTPVRKTTPSACICATRRSICDFSILKSGMP